MVRNFWGFKKIDLTNLKLIISVCFKFESLSKEVESAP